MKRSSLLLLAVLAVLGACTKELRTEKLFLEEEIPFHEGSAFNLSLRYDVQFPTGGLNAEAIEAMRKTIRTTCFGEPYADFTAPLNELAQTVRDACVQDYKSSNEALLQELGIPESEANTLSWATDIRGEFKESYEHWINYLATLYDYEGGAHGLTSEIPIVFDKQTGVPVTYDVFTGNLHPERLATLLDTHKFDKLELPEGIDTENVFYVDNIQPSRLFSVTEEGITFYYQPYEIAPYVFGVIPITIPWEELK